MDTAISVAPPWNREGVTEEGSGLSQEGEWPKRFAAWLWQRSGGKWQGVFTETEVGGGEWREDKGAGGGSEWIDASAGGGEGPPPLNSQSIFKHSPACLSDGLGVAMDTDSPRQSLRHLSPPPRLRLI